MELSGKTKIFAVLGHPVAHTLSPAMHNANFRSLGMDAAYVAFDVLPEALPGVLTSMQAMGFGGASLTMPLKEVAFRTLPHLDVSARKAGAVNTVRFGENGMEGWNTDGEGLLRAIRDAFGCGLAGLRVFVIGCGGAGRTAAAMAVQDGAAEVVLANRDPGRSARLAESLASDVVSISKPEEWAVHCRACDVVLHCTTVGMKAGEASLLPHEAFRPGQIAMDLIYVEPETPFMRAAKAGGARTANGLGMLLHQGIRQFEIWTGFVADASAMRAALEKAVYGT